MLMILFPFANGRFVMDGFFYFFGFTPNPASKRVEEILKEQPADKIKNDLKRVKGDYVRSYQSFLTTLPHNFLN